MLLSAAAVAMLLGGEERTLEDHGLLCAAVILRVEQIAEKV